MNGRVLLVVGSLIGGQLLSAQTAPPASDNPTASLNLDDAPKPVASQEAPSAFLAKFNHHLVVLDHDRMKPADSTALNGVKYVAFYYSAKWCPPCRAFSPKLVDFYNDFQKAHPNFELIFVDRDPDEAGMLAYMQMDRMPWLAVRHDDIDSSSVGARQFEAQYIPCLVLVDDSGKILADTMVDGQYAGPEQVVDQIKKLVPKPPQVTAGL